MKLIRELCEEVQYIKEKSESGLDILKLRGPMLTTVPNRNKRVYSESTLRPVVDKFIEEKIATGTSWGELGHPKGEDGPKIHEPNVSHLITGLKWEGKQVIGESSVLPYGPGLMIRGMIEVGGKPGMSTRGLGSIKQAQNGLSEVQNDYRLITIDAVTDPSGPGCFVEGIMEGVEWIYDATKDTWMEQHIEQVVETIKKMSNRQRTETQLRLFETYLAGISRPTKKRR